MRTRRHPGQGSGFTLIEILLAIGILVIGITAVLFLFTMGARSHRRASDRTRAALLAETVLNQIQADLAATLPSRYKEDDAYIWLLDPATGQEIAEKYHNPALHADFPEFRYYVTLAKLYPSDPSSRDFYKARVVVLWATEGRVKQGEETQDKVALETFETILRRKNY